jgi:hypothetical protein
MRGGIVVCEDGARWMDLVDSACFLKLSSEQQHYLPEQEANLSRVNQEM